MAKRQNLADEKLPYPDDPMFLGPSLRNFNMCREIEIVKLCLKHFRQQGYDSAFKALQEQTNIRLEHPLITDLHKFLVLDGDFEKAEDFLVECCKDGLMDSYLERQDYKHMWIQQPDLASSGSDIGSEDSQMLNVLRPGNRGGHQIVVDGKSRLFYMYGGWDGFQDLTDMWIYNMATKEWSVVRDPGTGWPNPRSCHKMVFDPVTENIYMLGRWMENSIRTSEYNKSDFYLYDTKAQEWRLVCEDTSQEGGPQLVFDHQMCIDVEKRSIYVFGGKILTQKNVSISSSEPEYSGLYSYNIDTNQWKHIPIDGHNNISSNGDVATATPTTTVKSRANYCMVFNHKNRKLYIYGGQRGKEDIDEFLTYDVDTGIIQILNNTQTKDEQPPYSQSVRASIDCDREEIYLLSSLSKQKDRKDDHIIDATNAFWVYSLQTNKWSRIYTYKHNSNSNDCPVEPCPRFAHQFVYDDVEKVHYLFGGNPGKSNIPQMRLDDFWILKLEKPKREELLKMCRYLVRKYYYEEIIKVDPIKALQYLQKHIAEVIDHNDTEQLNSFHKLASLLFKPEDQSGDSGPSCGMLPVNSMVEQTDADKNEDDVAMSTSDDLSMQSFESNASSLTQSTSSSISDSASYNLYKKCGGKRNRNDFLLDVRSRRTKLFNKLVQYMPVSMVHPKGNLSDFVVI